MILTAISLVAIGMDLFDDFIRDFYELYRTGSIWYGRFYGGRIGIAFI